MIIPLIASSVIIALVSFICWRAVEKASQNLKLMETVCDELIDERRDLQAEVYALREMLICHVDPREVDKYVAMRRAYGDQIWAQQRDEML